MRSLISSLTALALLQHMLFGCGCHCSAVPAEEHAAQAVTPAPVKTCRHASHRHVQPPQPAQQEDSPAPHEPCECDDCDCVALKGEAVRTLDHSRVFFDVALADAGVLIAERVTPPSDRLANDLGPPVRTHLLLQVLRI